MSVPRKRTLFTHPRRLAGRRATSWCAPFIRPRSANAPSGCTVPVSESPKPLPSMNGARTRSDGQHRRLGAVRAPRRRAARRASRPAAASSGCRRRRRRGLRPRYTAKSAAPDGIGLSARADLVAARRPRRPKLKRPSGSSCGILGRHHRHALRLRAALMMIAALNSGCAVVRDELPGDARRRHELQPELDARRLAAAAERRPARAWSAKRRAREVGRRIVQHALRRADARETPDRRR